MKILMIMYQWKGHLNLVARISCQVEKVGLNLEVP